MLKKYKKQTFYNLKFGRLCYFFSFCKFKNFQFSNIFSSSAMPRPTDEL